jgi:hypothetical protein
MNGQKIWMVSSLIIISVFLSSCREIRTSTKINADGSCQRTVVMEGDSTYSLNGSYPVPRDSSWTVVYDDKSDPKTYTITKSFPSVKRMNREYSRPKPDTLMQLRLSMRLQKKFRWFHTIYRYSEIYHTINPFPEYPVSDYLTPEELQLYYLDEDTLDLDDKVDNWLTESMLQEFLSGLYAAADSLKDTGITKKMIESRKDTLIQVLKSDLSDDELPGQILSIFNSSGNESMKKFVTSIIQEMNRKNEFIFDLTGNYTNQVIIPGLVLDTNAKTLEGNTITWQFESRHFLFEDYEMWVESRVVNRWAIILTGVIGILLIVSLVLGSLLSRAKPKTEKA